MFHVEQFLPVCAYLAGAVVVFFLVSIICALALNKKLEARLSGRNPAPAGTPTNSNIMNKSTFPHDDTYDADHVTGHIFDTDRDLPSLDNKSSIVTTLREAHVSDGHPISGGLGKPHHQSSINPPSLSASSAPSAVNPQTRARIRDFAKSLPVITPNAAAHLRDLESANML